MNNELGRKITSLTLMTIMVAGGMTIAAPGFMPAAHAANANLFVSAENSAFDNYMSGPQVIEVVVIDSDIVDTDQSKGEPDVTINGKKLRMAQAVDGNWYGYFADRTQAQIADRASNSTTNNFGTSSNGTSLDFGTFCSAASGTATLGFSTTETSGFAIPVSNATDSGSGRGGLNSGFGIGQAGGGVIDNTAAGGNCTPAGLGWSAAAATTLELNGTGTVAMNVVREAKDLNTGAGISTVSIGQIGFNAGTTEAADINGQWPFIQLYPLSVGGNVVVQYNKGGGAQTATLTFDTTEGYSSATLDRTIYPQSAQVHLTINDLWLNVDPTDEDSWTFGANATNVTSHGPYYQVFDENGAQAGDSVAGGAPNLIDDLADLMIETQGILILDANSQSATNAVITVQDNDDSVISCSTANDAGTCTTTGSAQLADMSLTEGTVPITITEQGPNSGIFGTYDESDVSALVMTTNAARGTSATITWNEVPVTVLTGFDFATIDIAPTDDEWSSGEEIPVTLVDFDANKNSRADEDLDVNDPNVSLIPSLKSGTPFTITNGSFVMVTQSNNDLGNTIGSVDTAWTLEAGSNNRTNTNFDGGSGVLVDTFSERAIFTNATADATATYDLVLVDLNKNMSDLWGTIGNTNTSQKSGDTRLIGFNLIQVDLRSFSTSGNVDLYLFNQTDTQTAMNLEKLQGTGTGSPTAFLNLANSVGIQSLTSLNNTNINTVIFTEQGSTLGASATDRNGDVEIGLAVEFNTPFTEDVADDPFVIDFFSFGFTDDGNDAGERVSNQIVRFELEETGDNTSTFIGTIEYAMINQLNINVESTYTALTPIADDPTFIVIEDLTDEDAPRINYNDLGADGVVTPIADQEEAPTHSGVVSFDSDSYKIADTVTVTLEDQDLNTDSDLIDIFTVVSTSGDEAFDAIGLAGQTLDLSFGDLGRMLDITFDDERWLESNETGDDGTVTCGTNVAVGITDGLGETGFTLVETGTDTGVFTGDFQVPSNYCKRSGFTGTGGTSTTTTGTDIEVNYVDYRDASGEIIEVGDSAGIRANTGSISLDRTVYPVPWGSLANLAGTAANQSTNATTPNGLSIFPVHATGLTDNIDTAAETLGAGPLTIHVRVNDPDLDLNPMGEDTMATDTAATAVGPVKISVSRGADTVVLAYAGGAGSNTNGIIDVGDDSASTTRTLGSITEIAPDAGIFELDFTILYTDGPASTVCPVTTVFTSLDGDSGVVEADRFDAASAAGSNYCILQGDILTVEYTDATDASGDVNTVTDSATFDLRNGVLQSDKSVYIIGSDMILTIIEPDWDLESDGAETYSLNVIEWDSDAVKTVMGSLATAANAAAFDPEPTDFRETGDSTGIFQIVIEIPQTLSGDNLERGEEIVLEYTDWGPSGSDFVGQEDEDVNVTVFTSNFGATVELDQKVYTWTDKVYITIVAPDHNFDSDLVDEIGNTSTDPIKVSTRGFNMNTYKLVETGTDTGIFTGEVILTGFLHDADGDINTGNANGQDTNPRTGDASGNNKNSRGPTDGFLETDEDDGLTVSFEFSEDETVVGSALIRWNIGEVQWLEASYPASGTGVVRVIDPDMNIDPEAVDNFNVDVWSDSDAGGIDLTVTETNEATGIFEGTVFFTTTNESSGHRLRVAEGDTVTAEYEDNTLPDPYTTADELDITATTLIGTVVPPLERAPAANLRTVDAFGNSLDAVSVDQQVQISADLANGQDREQAFAYLVQIQDGDGVTVSLAWITGSLSSGQSFSPALSWIPTEAGTYTATAFVWESVDNPTALSPPVSTTISVS